MRVENDALWAGLWVLWVLWARVLWVTVLKAMDLPLSLSKRTEPTPFGDFSPWVIHTPSKVPTVPTPCPQYPQYPQCAGSSTLLRSQGTL